MLSSQILLTVFATCYAGNNLSKTGELEEIAPESQDWSRLAEQPIISRWPEYTAHAQELRGQFRKCLLRKGMWTFKISVVQAYDAVSLWHHRIHLWTVCLAALSFPVYEVCYCCQRHIQHATSCAEVVGVA